MKARVASRVLAEARGERYDFLPLAKRLRGRSEGFSISFDPLPQASIPLEKGGTNVEAPEFGFHRNVSRTPSTRSLFAKVQPQPHGVI